MTNFVVHDAWIHGRSGQDSQLFGICVFFLAKALILNKYTQEYGIFDALEKNYLQSFIFAIYLVCQDIC